MACKVFVDNGPLPQDEIQAYIDRGREKYGRDPLALRIKVCGDEVELDYELDDRPPFQRIRRITGYLVGTLDRFNDGKRSEERDRVKHGVNLQKESPSE